MGVKCELNGNEDVEIDVKHYVGVERRIQFCPSPSRAEMDVVPNGEDTSLLGYLPPGELVRLVGFHDFGGRRSTCASFRRAALNSSSSAMLMARSAALASAWR